MQVREAVRSTIRNSWNNPQVAEWVIWQLPLLREHVQETKPIFILSSEGELRAKERDSFAAEKFLQKHKIILSGGLEGTLGHMHAVWQIHEYKWLAGECMDSDVVLALEPDSYIRQKCRKPLATQEQRAEMWATSGKVDAVVCLPEPRGRFDTARYVGVHQRIKPAAWMASSRMPFWKEVIMRDGVDAIITPRIISESVTPHASFLKQTQAWDREQTLEGLRVHIGDMLRDEAPTSGDFNDRVDACFSVVAGGLLR